VSSGVFYLLLPAETDAYKRLHFWADKKAKIIGFKCKKGGINCIRVIKIEKAD
jgi:hypothetical protein